MERVIDTPTGKYLITKQISAIVSRQGRQDIIIRKAGAWGVRHTDGRLYRICKIIDRETTEVVRNYELTPAVFNNENLLLWGFFKK